MGTGLIIEVPWELADSEHCPSLADRVKHERSMRRSGATPEAVAVNDYEFSRNPDLLEQLAAAAAATNNRALTRVTSALIAAKAGGDAKAPRLSVGGKLIADRIKASGSDWLYRRVTSGEREYFLPELVTSVEYVSEDPQRNQSARVILTSARVSVLPEGRGRTGLSTSRTSFDAGDVVNKTAAETLSKANLFLSTDELRRQYEEYARDFAAIAADGFARQYRARSWTTNEWRRGRGAGSEKVVMTSKRDVAVDLTGTVTKGLLSEESPVPLDLRVDVFGLTSHDFGTAYTMDLTEYEYDKQLRERLVLPEAHKDLLDILTTDIDVLSSDIIEGKAAGNVILARGIPGVGKTLTAEVYAEATERPLYAVRAGELGTSAESVSKALKVIFERVMEWDAVLLLDEADVFVRVRGDDIRHNAVVAEFLRALEYFKGLMFMTTNRIEDIDEAIVSRCAAVITYGLPDEKDRPKVWRVLADTLGAKIDDATIARASAMMPNAAPRDMKMVLRLAARMAASRKEKLSIEHLRQAAIFRMVEWKDG